MTNVAIITGGSRGLGRALAEDLAQDGWHVIVDARDRTALHAAMAGAGPRVRAVPGDVSDPEHRAALVAAAADLGRLDLLVNNASSLGPTPLPSLRHAAVADLEEVLRVNLVAPLGLIQLALPLLAASHGAVLDITSDAGVEGYAGWGLYGASKAALDQLGNVLAVEEPAVRVWSLDPGDMRTQMHQDAFPGEDISDRPEPATVIPAIRRLLRERPASGRVRASDLQHEVLR
jgi:NAD(P)-dependent dehydrogenase (short-subunit alcohol dehydrogenase family)